MVQYTGVKIKKEKPDGLSQFYTDQIKEGKYDFKKFIKNQPIGEIKRLKETLCRIKPFTDGIKDKVLDPWNMPFMDGKVETSEETIFLTQAHYVKWLPRD